MWTFSGGCWSALTPGALRALRGRRDRELAIVGFDDFPRSDLVEPPVTVVQQDVVALGLAVCDLLLERMNGTTQPPQTVVIPTRLVERR